MENIYQTFNHAKGCNMWHLQWCTKYRFKMFQHEYLIKFCDLAIREVCLRNKIGVVVLNIQPDHVHIIVSLPRGMTDIKALQLIKGTTAFYLFRLEPRLKKRYPRRHFWSRGSFACTVGFAQLETVIEYVKNQGQ